jgi:hypothetical protein
VGDTLTFKSVVSDPTLLDDFVNNFSLSVKPEVVPHPNPGTRRKPPSNEPGKEREVPTGIAMPNIIPVKESEWLGHEPAFDKNTALRVRITDDGKTPSESESQHDVYDFLVNMDNVFLKSELKNSKDAIELVQKRWQYALVLIGLALIHDDKQRTKNGGTAETNEEENGSGATLEQKIEIMTCALAPILLPMIESLGALDVDTIAKFAASAEAV